ncbi:MAG TPA: hypothetical protein VII60_02130 [Acidimicrobiales bacterium]
MSRFGSFGGLGRGGKKALSEEQIHNRDNLQQEKVDEVLSKQDARYDAMTPEEREEYYLKPSLLTKLKKAFRGQ